MAMDVTGSFLQRLERALDVPASELAGYGGMAADALERWETDPEAVPEELHPVLVEIEKALPAAEFARTELTVLHVLLRDLDAEIARFSSFSTGDVVMNPKAFEQVPDRNRQTVADLKLLREQAYCRVVRARETNTGRERVFRITWGARGKPEHHVYQRNAPLIAGFMSARPGDALEIATPRGAQSYEVIEVSLLTRHTGRDLIEEIHNFARADYAIDAAGRASRVLETVRGWLLETRTRLLDSLAARETLGDAGAEQSAPALTQSDRATLNERFFMSPLAAQEAIMSLPPEGHILVEGVAGSGKTSVALGRTAHICMERDDHGGIGRFAPQTGVGFVLSEQLVGYLEALLTGNLRLHGMPVKSYFALRQELLGFRALLKTGARREQPDSEQQDSVIGSWAWAEAVGEVMAQLISNRLLALLPDDFRAFEPAMSASVTASHWSAVIHYRERKDDDRPPRNLWSEFRAGLPAAFGVRRAGAVATLEGSLEAVDRMRGDFVRRLETLDPWDSPRLREDRGRIRTRLRDAVITAFDYASRYFETVQSPDFGAAITRYFGASASPAAAEVSAAIEATRARAARKVLNNPEIDVLLALAQRAATGYIGRDNAQPIAHLAQERFHTHVFIDEVQDFSEVQVRVMVGQADPRYRSVTAVGDFAQRLARGGLTSSARSGLLVSDSETVFLRMNKRQTAPLHAFSSAFRAAVVGDPRPAEGEPARESDERPFVFGEGDAATEAGLREWLPKTREQYPSYTIGVLCPTPERARGLEAALHEEMWAQNILTRAADSLVDAAKLTDAFYVHFTTPQRAKGLEFDAVFAVDIDAYDLTDGIARSALYVSLSRARRRLGVGFRKAPAGALAELVRSHADSTSA